MEMPGPAGSYRCVDAERVGIQISAAPILRAASTAAAPEWHEQIKKFADYAFTASDTNHDGHLDFQEQPPALALVVVFSFQLIGEMPVLPHDVACDGVVSDRQVYDPRGLLGAAPHAT